MTDFPAAKRVTYDADKHPPYHPFEMGVAAAHAGKSRDENPFLIIRFARESWFDGFDRTTEKLAASRREEVEFAK